MKKTNIFELLVGLNRIKLELGEGRFVTIPEETLTIKCLPGNRDSIADAIHYINDACLNYRGNSMKNAILEISEKDLTFTLRYNRKSVEEILSVFRELYDSYLFNGKPDSKVIQALNHNHANKLIPSILTLCNLKLYGGYSYNYSTHEIVVFC